MREWSIKLQHVFKHHTDMTIYNWSHLVWGRCDLREGRFLTYILPVVYSQLGSDLHNNRWISNRATSALEPHRSSTHSLKLKLASLSYGENGSDPYAFKWWCICIAIHDFVSFIIWILHCNWWISYWKGLILGTYCSASTTRTAAERCAKVFFRPFSARFRPFSARFPPVLFDWVCWALWASFSWTSMSSVRLCGRVGR